MTSAPTVLLTGATGFIGGATLARLLESHSDCRVLLLARDRGSEAAADRVRHSLARFVGPERAEDGIRSCEVIRGDVTDASSLGLHVRCDTTHAMHLATKEKVAAERLNDVTHVIHLASNTSFRSIRSVRHTNIFGALTLAHRCTSGVGSCRCDNCTSRG
jgi:nucleoside-diphosphate-sugar epimerase